MREQLEQRLNQLMKELQSGEQMLAEQEKRRTQLRETLLRISGAIQVLEEALAGSDLDSLPGTEGKVPCP